MVHEIHLAVAVAAITVLVPIALVSLSMNPLGGDMKQTGMLQSAEGAETSVPVMSNRQNPMETLEEAYNSQAFAEIARCAGPDSDERLLCEDTMQLLIRTCADRAIERIKACDDARLEAYGDLA